MDRDDPEKRIADLERQLAEARAAAASPTGGCVTPEQVRNVVFSKPPIGSRGYNEDEVDAFLDRVEGALRDPTGRALTSEQVRNVAFSKPPIGKRGYNQDEVDAFLDRVEQQMESQQGASPLPSQAGLSPPPHVTEPAAPIRCVLFEIPSRRKVRRKVLRRDFSGPHPGLVIDVGKDAIWVRDPETNAPIASARLEQVTATPAEQMKYEDSGFFGRVYTRPLLVVRIPGLQPLTITSAAMTGFPIQYRFSWRGTVAKAKNPDHVVTEAEFLTLVGKFGLASHLEDRMNRG
jgi:DivIVA domain-containing protein